MCSQRLLDVRCLSRGWRHLVNAYEGRQSWCNLQVKLRDPYWALWADYLCHKALNKYSAFFHLTTFRFRHMDYLSPCNIVRSQMKHWINNSKVLKVTNTHQLTKSLDNNRTITKTWRQCSITSLSTRYCFRHAVDGLEMLETTLSNYENRFSSRYSIWKCTHNVYRVHLNKSHSAKIVISRKQLNIERKN